MSFGQENKRIANIFLTNPKIKLSQEQFNKVFNSKDVQLKISLISNNSIPFSIEQINDGILDKNEMSLAYAKRHGTNIYTKTIDGLIEDDSYSGENILLELLKNNNINIKFTSKQIDLFLESNNFELRVAVAKNYNIQFNENQIIKGLNDKGFEYEAYDNSYDGFSKSDVIEAFLENPNIIISKNEISNIIKNKDYLIEILLERKDIEFEDSHINSILEMNNSSSVMLLSHSNLQLNDNQILKLLYQKPYWPKYIAEYYLNKENITVSETVLNVLKISESEEIQKVIIEKGTSLLSSVKNNFKKDVLK
jgi:hypothetical protein